MSLRDLLESKLTKSELKYVPRSFDIIGSKEKAIAIVEIPDKLKKRRRMIANAIMKHHKNVKAVLEKASPRKGVYRIREMKIITGSKNTVVVHKENGCSIGVDPRTVYFSPREGTERLRVAQKVGDNETVMIFFAGTGPFACVVGRIAKPEKIIGIEINPVAVRFFKQNIELNKLKNTIAIKGDVKSAAKNFYDQCDRVIMPLPESAVDFLDEAIMCLKSGGICHLYCFSTEDDLKNIRKKISAAAKKLNRKAKFLETQKVLPWGPKIWKWRVDFQVA
jgi:tRNA (guanine37-N1)-methyltransferase